MQLQRDEVAAEEICLCGLQPGERARVTGIDAKGGIRRRFLDIGLVLGTQVECAGRSPLGDPAAYLICGAVIAIRDRDSRHIRVRVAADGNSDDDTAAETGLIHREG